MPNRLTLWSQSYQQLAFMSNQSLQKHDSSSRTSVRRQLTAKKNLFRRLLGSFGLT